MFAKPIQTPPTPPSYYLKVWQVNENETPVWKALLVSIDSDESFAFPNLETLYAFLNEPSPSSLTTAVTWAPYRRK